MYIAYMPFLIPIVAILAWAAVQVSKNIGGSADTEDLIADLAALADDLDDAHAERDRLRARIEALEAIVTAEHDPLGFDAIVGDEEATGTAPRRTRA